MFVNYLKVAIRSMLKHRIYSIINITGLAIGMTCCILIMLWVQDELGYDRFHAQADRIYRVGHHLTLGGNTQTAISGSAPMAPAMIGAFPEVVNATRINPAGRLSVKYGNKEFFEDRIFHADNSFFDIFSFPLMAGDSAALAAANSAVITEKMAEKYFGDEDPIGKILRLGSQDDYVIMGVMANIPANSHIRFDMLCSFENLLQDESQMMNHWGRLGVHTYLLLSENADYRELERKFPALIDANLGETLSRVGGSLELFLQPMKRIHLHSNFSGDLWDNGDIAYVYLFSGIALFILLIACFNFINIATARSATRAQEVGMRRILGAARGKLVGQFLGESMVYGLLAMILASILLEAAFPLFKSISGRELTINYLRSPWVIPGLLGFALLAGLLAGAYPAFFLSSFRPIRILKGNLKSGASNSRFRRALVITQFTISVALIVGTLTVVYQLDFMKNKKLGFDKEQLVIIPNLTDTARHSLASIKHELAGLPGVINVASASNIPGQGGRMTNFLPEGFAEDESVLMMHMDIDDKCIPTLGFRLSAGRNFSADRATDTIESAIINETAVKMFHWQDPIGKTIVRRIMGPGREPQTVTTRVIGVVEDFHLNSLHRVIEPLFIGNTPGNQNTLAVRITSDDIPQTVARLRDKWTEIYPDQPLDHFFLDESFDRSYQAEERLSAIFLSFSLLAVFIGGLGLFGMSAFTAEQRTKEIGIRKVLGASIGRIVALLSKEFLILVAVANVIAWPIAYYGMNRWLQNFAYRDDIGWGVYALAGLASLLIALMAVSFQSIKAARTNPVDTIKYE